MGIWRETLEVEGKLSSWTKSNIRGERSTLNGQRTKNKTKEKHTKPHNTITVYKRIAVALMGLYAEMRSLAKTAAGAL